MKRIETMKCKYPILFWIGWVAIAVWMVMCVANYAFGYTLIEQPRWDDVGGFLLILGMFLMFRSLDWCEVEFFVFVKHPGRLRKIGYDYVFMFMVFLGLDIIQIELLQNTLVILALGIYLYDMLKLIGFHWTRITSAILATVVASLMSCNHYSVWRTLLFRAESAPEKGPGEKGF